MRALLLAALGLVMVPIGQDGAKRPLTASFVVTSKSAYFVAPSRSLTDGVVDSVRFSPDGRFAHVFGRSRPKATAEGELERALDVGRDGEGELWMKIWDVRSGSVRDVPKSVVARLFDPQTAMEFTVLPNVVLLKTQNRTVTSSKPVDRVSYVVDRLSLTDGSVKRLVSFEHQPSVFVTMEVSPTQPFFVVHTASRNKPVDVTGHKTTLAFSKYDLNGNLVKSGQAEVAGRAMLSGWTKDGANMVGYTSRVAGIGKRPTGKTLVANLATGVISETTEEIPTYGDEEAPQELATVLADGETKVGGMKVPIRSLWLASSDSNGQGAAFIAADVEGAWLSPDLHVVAYTVEGRLFARELALVDLASYSKAMKEAGRREAMDRVKNIATGVAMYCADNDDVFPLAGDIKESVGPYVKSLSAFDGFVYTFSGRNANDIKDPAGTEIGYLPVEGGRCVAFADGHVKFVPDP